MMTSGDAGTAHGNVPSQPPPAIKVSLGGFLLLFVVSRLLYLMLIDPDQLLLYGSEELYRGTIAQELVTGPTLPFTEYRADNYSGGSLVIGALAGGFFLLFGPTVFALKLAPLLLFTLALVFWYWTIQRAAGERVAGYFAILFCFSPPLLTAHSVTTMGFHSESIFFSALTVFLLFRMLSDETGSLAYPIPLGLTAGFGLWFCYTYGLTLLALLGFWLWHDKGRFWRPRVLWFALGFVVGFFPWVIMNMQTHFAGLVVQGKNVWEHFGLAYLWDGLAHPRKLALYEFFADIASNDPRNLPRRAVNLLYSILYLGPILTAGVLWLKTVRSEPAGVNDRGREPRVSTSNAGTRPSRTHPTQPTLVGFGILYLVVFALALHLSDLRHARYHLPAYPFLFFLTAYSLARCQDLVPHVTRQIQIVFLASVVVLGLGTHAPLLTLDRPGFALSAKGYAYALMPGAYLFTHTPAGSYDRESVLELVNRPFLSDILPKLSSDDQQELSREIARLLADVAPLNGPEEDFSRIERLVPPGFDRYFYYQVGATAMGRHPNELPKAVAAVEFARHRSATTYHLVLIGIYRSWAADSSTILDGSPEVLASSPAPVAPELSPHYWRALGHYAGRYWYDTEHSLSLLNVHLQEFVPRLEPSVQRAFLQGIGQALFVYPKADNRVLPAEIERSPHAYQEGLLEGWGMALGEHQLYYEIPWKGSESLYGMAATKSLSARNLVSIQRGKAQFDALFEGPASRALEVPHHAR